MRTSLMLILGANNRLVISGLLCLFYLKLSLAYCWPQFLILCQTLKIA